nr:uncharacterized protein LOC111424507 [Onthophagus taurus]
MKSSVVVAVLFLTFSAHGLTPEQQAKVKEHFKDCIATTGAIAEDVHKSREGNFVDDPKIGAFVFCFFKKVGFMNEAGDFQSEVVKAKLSPELSAADVEAVLGKCSSTTGKDNHEKAYNIYKCYWGATPNHVKLI